MVSDEERQELLERSKRLPSIQISARAMCDLELLATIDGTIVEMDLIEGQRVTPGLEVLRLADFSQWYVETDNLTEIEVVDIALGEQASITPDALPDLMLNGEVESISDLFEEKRGDVTYTARIKLGEIDPRLRWGMTAAIHPIDDATTAQIIHKLGQDVGLEIPGKITDYLLTRVPRDFLSIKDCVTRIDRESYLKKQKVSLKLTKAALGLP
jgi:hypothetical protein